MLKLRTIPFENLAPLARFAVVTGFYRAAHTLANTNDPGLMRSLAEAMRYAAVFLEERLLVNPVSCQQA